MINKHGFASDNNSGVHPAILQAIMEANQGHTLAYGEDMYTEKAKALFRELLGTDVEVFFVFNGTAANVLGLQAATQRHNAVICAETAHINVDECGAPERITGCKLLTVKTPDGKLTPSLVSTQMHGFGFQHHSQPKVISISQASELGTVYTPEEVKSLSDFAHSHGLYLHMDGTRITNAAVSQSCSLKEISGDAGVDVLSFGGTKNGLMYGEAVVFFNSSIAKDFMYTRKQDLQLASKMRFISAQFIAYLSNNQWATTARHSNQMAQLLADKLRRLSAVKISQKVQVNEVLAIIPPEIIPELQKEYFFYIWDEATSEVRLMTSWDTTEEDIDRFTEILEKLLKKFNML